MSLQFVALIREGEENGPLPSLGTGIQRAHVTVQTSHTDIHKAHAELNSADAGQAAIIAASQRGIPDPRISGSAKIYGVDEQGQEIKFEKGKTPASPAAYRADIPVTQRLV